MEHISSPTLAEDLLLVLFQPEAGVIAGENILCDVLAGAVLAELAFNENVKIELAGAGIVRVEAVEKRAPSDGILRSAWDYAADNPGLLQPMLAAIGNAIRQPLLERLVARGDIREENGKVLGMLRKTTLKDGGSGRRSGLVADIRSVLVDGADPTARVGALTALVWGSGTLQQVDPAIPWNPAVAARAEALGRGDWAAGEDWATTRASAVLIAGIVASTLDHSGGSG